jgi:hypothetical protein
MGNPDGIPALKVCIDSVILRQAGFGGQARQEYKKSGNKFACRACYNQIIAY